ncbi:alginate O-acetyltransferase AlgX-related protein [Halovulum sp. GXIMD14794]
MALATDANAQLRSAYGCEGLEDAPRVASIEGRGGVFFRLRPDLQMTHPFSDEVIEDLGKLSRALARRGTLLVYAPVPTKALAMPQDLPAEAADYGYDPLIAGTVYEELMGRLRDADVATADLRAAMRALWPQAQPFFEADPRMSVDGARAAARAVAAIVRDRLPAAGGTRFASVSTGRIELASQHRTLMQRHCSATLPQVATDVFETRALSASGGGESGAMFLDRRAPDRLVLVGTEHSATTEVNFAGFLAEATGMEVERIAQPGGGAFGAITAYLTSRAFQDAPPTVLVWENPIENNLGGLADQPMRELIAAASAACRVPLTMVMRGDPRRLDVDLSGQPVVGHMIQFDADTTAEAVRFRFVTSEGRARSRTIRRPEGQPANGRFFVPVDGLFAEAPTALEIDLPVPVGEAPSLSICQAAEG